MVEDYVWSFKGKIRAQTDYYWMLRRWLAHLGGVQSSSITSGDTTAQQTHFVHWCPVVHLCKGDLRHHGVLGERAAAHVVEQVLAFVGIWWSRLASGLYPV